MQLDIKYNIDVLTCKNLGLNLFHGLFSEGLSAWRGEVGGGGIGGLLKGNDVVHILTRLRNNVHVLSELTQKKINVHLLYNRPGLQTLTVPWPDDPVNDET